jgi:hypothetical protein
VNLDDADLPCEPGGHGVIATGSVESCKELWRIFVRSSVVMDWIDNGYHLLWVVVPPASREMSIAHSTRAHHEFVSSIVPKMLTAHAGTLLPPGEKPTAVSPLGVVPKRGTSKFRLTVNMRYVNRHLGKNVFKFEGLRNLVDLTERGDHAVSYDLMAGYYHVGLRPRSRTVVGSQWEQLYFMYNCLPFGISTSPWVSQK